MTDPSTGSIGKPILVLCHHKRAPAGRPASLSSRARSTADNSFFGRGLLCGRLINHVARKMLAYAPEWRPPMGLLLELGHRHLPLDAKDDFRPSSSTAQIFFRLFRGSMVRAGLPDESSPQSLWARPATSQRCRRTLQPLWAVPHLRQGQARAFSHAVDQLRLSA